MIPGKYLVKKLCSEVITWYETAEIVAFSEQEAIEMARYNDRDEDGDDPYWSDRCDEDYKNYDEEFKVSDIIYQPEEEEEDEEESAELVKPAGVLTVFLEGVEL